ncbi:epimerase [Lysobacteraceae bacterium NML07-0707]|nr:epimerase [Xanthomonadaceae bacterium NML07-0707]
MHLSALPQSILIFGQGYTAGFIARALREAGVRVIATRRMAEGEVRGFDGEAVDARLLQDIAGVQAVLSSIPPDAGGDPATRWLSALPQAATRHLRWFGYLSSTAVYAAGKVDEATPVAPQDETGSRRVLAESQWQALADACGAASAMFRLPAIYGPGRNALTQLAEGKARLVDSPVRFNRVHVEDIARIVLTAMMRPRKDAVYLPCDEAPASQAEVLRHAAQLSGLALPPAQTLDDPALSPALRRFYQQGEKHIDNSSTCQELDWQPLYRDYRQGLEAAWQAGDGRDYSTLTTA